MGKRTRQPCSASSSCEMASSGFIRDEEGGGGVIGRCGGNDLRDGDEFGVLEEVERALAHVGEIGTDQQRRLDEAPGEAVRRPPDGHQMAIRR